MEQLWSTSTFHVAGKWDKHVASGRFPNDPIPSSQTLRSRRMSVHEAGCGLIGNYGPSIQTNGFLPVDGRNPANQLRLVVYPTLYRVLAPSQVVVWDFVHQQYHCILCDEKKRLIKEHGIPVPRWIFCSYWWIRQTAQQFCPRHFVETTTLRGEGSKNCNNDSRPIFDRYFPVHGSVPSFFGQLLLDQPLSPGMSEEASQPQEQSHAECVSEGLGCYGRTWFFFSLKTPEACEPTILRRGKVGWDLDIRPYDFLAWLHCL